MKNSLWLNYMFRVQTLKLLIVNMLSCKKVGIVQFPSTAIVFVLLLSSLFTDKTEAQNKLIEEFEKPAVQIVIGKINADQLPAPGLAVELTAELLNTRDFRQPLRLLLVRDQNFQEIITAPGKPDSTERPRYSISIPAPIVELSYQFVLTLPDGSVTTSPRHTVRRDCIPDINPALKEIDQELVGDDRFKKLIDQNKLIEHEITNLQSAIDDLKQVSTMLAK